MDVSAASFSVAAMDYFPQQERFFPGGNALNQAVHFQKLGLRSAFVGALGDDEAGRQIKQVLLNWHVDISRAQVVAGETAHNQIINDAEGERFGVEGAWHGGVFEGYQFTSADWAYLAQFNIWSSHISCPNMGEALQRKGANQFFAVDFLHQCDADQIKGCLPCIDIAYVGGTRDMLEPLAALSKTYQKLIVLTLGAEGAVAFLGDQRLQQPALPVDRVVDTTGCGDAFQATFTATYYQSRSIERALMAGVEAGKLNTQHFGGIPVR